MNKAQEEKIAKLGNLWEKGTMKRVYFSSDFIESATAFDRGVQMNMMPWAKFYYDFNTGNFGWKDMPKKAMELCKEAVFAAIN